MGAAAMAQGGLAEAALGRRGGAWGGIIMFRFVRIIVCMLMRRNNNIIMRRPRPPLAACSTAPAVRWLAGISKEATVARAR